MPPVLSRPEWIPLLPKPGTYRGHESGTVTLTREGNARYVHTFAAGVYQRHLPVSLEHDHKLGGAVGWIVGMDRERDGSVSALIQWSHRGRLALAEDRYRYISPELINGWMDPITGKRHDVVSGAALTTSPFWKDLELPKPQPRRASDPQPIGSAQVYDALRQLAAGSKRDGQTVEQRVVELLREYPSAGQWYEAARRREQATASPWPRDLLNVAVKRYCEDHPGVPLADAIRAVERQG